jgi:HEAT repeat protein
MEARREDYWYFLGDEKAEAYPDIDAVWRMPESLGLIKDQGYGPWKCPDCGTYYGLEVYERGLSWPRGSCQITLWRLTPAEAMETYRRVWAWERKGAPVELRRFEERLPEWMRDMRACLSHSDSAVRERAAQALASHFRSQSELAGVTALLGHADASVRRGTLLAFDKIRYVSLELGPADIVPTLLESLMDPDASVARQAYVLLRSEDFDWDLVFDEKKSKQSLDQVNAIPNERRTAAVRMFLVRVSTESEAHVAGLADPEQEVRLEALRRALTVSLGNTPFVTSLRTKLLAIPEAVRTGEMDAYLARENPQEWDDDD